MRRAVIAEIKVRNLDDAIASALKARARAKGVSLEAEVRRTLAVAADCEELVRCAKALPAVAGGKPGRPEFDSARLIREDRDAWS